MNVRALLELCRISNLPTVWSNAVVGGCAGLLAVQEGVGPLSPTVAILLILPAVMISFLYCAGMVLNDYWDREIDARERPDRPIPSGRVAPKKALSLAIQLFAAGWCYPLLMVLGVFFVTGPDITVAGNLIGTLPLIGSAGILTLLIIAYNRLHTKSTSAVILMALCRVFAVITAASMFSIWASNWVGVLFVIGPAITGGVYTLAISLIARREAEEKRFAGPKTVMNMIAAMPLLDAAWLLVMGLWPASLFCVGCAALTKLGHRKVAGS